MFRWSTTSATGLNFNLPSEGGETGHGPRQVLLGKNYFAYARVHEIGGRFFAFCNKGDLFRAPGTNDAGQVNTLNNADTEGGIWNPSGANTNAAWWPEISLGSNVYEQQYFQAWGDDEATRHTRALAQTEGIFAGFSSGANVAAALKLLGSSHKGKTILVVLCDSGLKYLSTDLWD